MCFGFTFVEVLSFFMYVQWKSMKKMHVQSSSLDDRVCIVIQMWSGLDLHVDEPVFPKKHRKNESTQLT